MKKTIQVNSLVVLGHHPSICRNFNLAPGMVGTVKGITKNFASVEIDGNRWTINCKALIAA